MRYFFLTPSATTEFSTLSLHDALPISEFGAPELEEEVGGSVDHLRRLEEAGRAVAHAEKAQHALHAVEIAGDRKSTRLNSSHRCISYAVFCLKKKKHRRDCARRVRDLE